MSFPTSSQHAQSSLSLESIQPCHQFTFSEIQLATHDFDESLVIGSGGFGKVYQGTISSGSSRVEAAIKRLESTSDQGAVEFWAEVDMLSKLRHRHLVSLIGYCNDEQEMILVYEYIPNGTLADRLHKYQNLTWVRRLKICIGAALGLNYLHTGVGTKYGVIHRDVKSSNILLDKSWEAMISDFGLSKIGPTNQPSTYVNTMVRGTFGYLDPNYFHTGKLTRKSDVYAFGVVLFEVLCGKKAVDTSIDEEECSLAAWAHDSVKEGRVKQIVDLNLRGSISPKCLKAFARLTDSCLHTSPKQRPTMAQVVMGLESILASQEKANQSLSPLDMKIFGKVVPTVPSPSSWENSDPDCELLGWDERYKIVLGVARALVYLQQHAPSSIIHRHVNPDNIHLDARMNPKLWNFNFAKDYTKTEDKNCKRTQVAGTNGYLAPEYLVHGRLSAKTDVYSFGVVFLETLSGRSNTPGMLEFVWSNWVEGTYSNIINPRIKINVDSIFMKRVIHIGLLCIQDDAKERPTMEEVVGMLLGISTIDLPVPKQPMNSGKNLDVGEEEIYPSDANYSTDEEFEGR